MILLSYGLISVDYVCSGYWNHYLFEGYLLVVILWRLLLLHLFSSLVSGCFCWIVGICATYLFIFDYFNAHPPLYFYLVIDCIGDFLKLFIYFSNSIFISVHSVFNSFICNYAVLPLNWILLNSLFFSSHLFFSFFTLINIVDYLPISFYLIPG